MKLLLSALAGLSIFSAQQICFAAEPPRLIGDSQAFTPEGILPAGIDSAISTNPYTGESGPARKGTVAATINNIALLNKLLSEKVSASNQTKIQEIINALTTISPSLRVIGIFDLFSLEEWLTDESQPGRLLVAALYLQLYPQEITSKIKTRLLKIQSRTKLEVLSESIAKALSSSKTLLTGNNDGEAKNSESPNR